MTRDEARRRLAGRHYFEARGGLLLIRDPRLIRLTQSARAYAAPQAPRAPIHPDFSQDFS